MSEYWDWEGTHKEAWEDFEVVKKDEAEEKLALLKKRLVEERTDFLMLDDQSHFGHKMMPKDEYRKVAMAQIDKELR